MLPPLLSGGDQEISMEVEVTSPTARLVTALGGEAIRNSFKQLWWLTVEVREKNLGSGN